MPGSNEVVACRESELMPAEGAHGAALSSPKIEVAVKTRTGSREMFTLSKKHWEAPLRTSGARGWCLEVISCMKG